jgi:hypothetical protein
LSKETKEKLCKQASLKTGSLNNNAIKVSISDYNSLGYYKENIRENENIVGMHRWDQLKSQVENQTKMTDRVKGFTVVLDKDFRIDDVEVTQNAIAMIKGVSSVQPIIANG